VKWLVVLGVLVLVCGCVTLDEGVTTTTTTTTSTTTTTTTTTPPPLEERWNSDKCYFRVFAGYKSCGRDTTLIGCDSSGCDYSMGPGRLNGCESNMDSTYYRYYTIDAEGRIQQRIHLIVQNTLIKGYYTQWFIISDEYYLLWDRNITNTTIDYCGIGAYDECVIYDSLHDNTYVNIKCLEDASDGSEAFTKKFRS
jgi:hypothetical protein